jgi:hypothetical protein
MRIGVDPEKYVDHPARNILLKGLENQEELSTRIQDAVYATIGQKLIGVGAVAVASVLALTPAGDIGPYSGSNIFQPGNQTAVAATKMKIEKLIEESTTPWKLENEAGIWGGKTFTFAGISKNFDATYDGIGAPTSALFVFANAGGATGDVVAVLGDTVARSNNAVAFGFNFIARNHTGIAAKLVGGEIDFEPNGVTPLPGSGALYINCFNVASPGAFIQLGTLGGGSLANGIIIHGVASTGAGVAAQAGTTMGSLIHTGIATYANDAIILTNLHKIRFQGTAAAHGKMYMDASDNFRIVAGSTNSIFFRNNGDSSSLFAFQAGGIAVAAVWDATTEFRANGVKILGLRGTALPADASDLASAITLINTLKARLSAASGSVQHPLFA